MPQEKQVGLELVSHQVKFSDDRSNIGIERGMPSDIPLSTTELEVQDDPWPLALVPDMPPLPPPEQPEVAAYTRPPPEQPEVAANAGPPPEQPEVAADIRPPPEQPEAAAYSRPYVTFSFKLRTAMPYHT